MPLMMEDDLPLMMDDDLFGDGPELSLPSKLPPTKELYQRLDELRNSSCCQSIAWSKWGSIASINANSTGLDLRNLRCHPKTGSWGLSEPHPTPALSTSSDGGLLKHLCWSPTGSELAVIDAAGRVTILAIFSSLNKPTLSRPCHSDPSDDLHGVVASHWLSAAPYAQNGRPASILLNGPAIKEGSGYRYDQSNTPVLGPSHPIPSKSALVCVTTNGMLRLLWPQSSGKWFETTCEVDSIVSSDDLITHAAICPDKGNTLLIAIATTSKELRTVRARFDWGTPKPNPNEKPPPPLQLNPSIRITHVAATSWLQDVRSNDLNASVESAMAQLSHLEFLPLRVDSQGRTLSPTILAVRSYLPRLSHYDQEVHSSLDRWELHEQAQVIHPAFGQLSSRRHSVGGTPGPTVFLKRLDSITVNKIVISIEVIQLGNVICFIYGDGSIGYRDRATMLQVFTDFDLNRVQHLNQIGFSYEEDGLCMQAALSPTTCSMIQLRNDGSIKWRSLDYQMGDLGSTMDDPHYAATVAALSLSCATAVMRGVNYDDLLAMVHKLGKENFGYDWLIELGKILKLPADYAEEQHYDVLIRNTTIQLCLSIQNSVGFVGEYHPRKFAGKFAWISLQLRNIVVLVAMAANMKVPGTNGERTTPLDDPEVINALAGSVRWVLDLMAWITDALLRLPTTLPSNIDLTQLSGFSLPDLLAHLRATNTISLHLLLSSPTRGFLTAICRRLQHLDYIARRAISTQPPSQNIPTGLSPELRAAYIQIAQLTSNCIIRIKTFETLLSSLTTSIKTIYNSTSSLSGSDAANKLRNNTEIKMLFCGEIPSAFKPVIVELFRGIVPSTSPTPLGLLATAREEFDPAKLFFGDFTMLEVDEDAGSMRKRKQSGLTMDCFRKGWMAKDGARAGAGRRWRRCARCAAVTEDVLTARQQLQWLVMQQRRCFCSGYWDTLAPGEMIA